MTTSRILCATAGAEHYPLPGKMGLRVELRIFLEETGINEDHIRGTLRDNESLNILGSELEIALKNRTASLDGRIELTLPNFEL